MCCLSPGPSESTSGSRGTGTEVFGYTWGPVVDSSDFDYKYSTEERYLHVDFLLSDPFQPFYPTLDLHIIVTSVVLAIYLGFVPYLFYSRKQKYI